MKSRFIKVVSTLTVLSCCVSAIPLQAPAAIVQATTTATNPLTTGEEQTEALHPKMINQATGEEFDQSIINYQAEIFLNDKFGEGKNAKISNSINLFGKNSVKDPNTPDAYEFQRVLLTSDADATGKKYTKEIEQIIKIGDSYYGLVKGTQQDYLKFSSQDQIQIIYNRFLRVGFKKSDSASDYILNSSSTGTGQIISGITSITPAEVTNGINESHTKDGFFVVNSSYVDSRLYYIPDFKSVEFSRPAFTQVSQKSGSNESNTAMKTTANFYEFIDSSESIKFNENLNGFSMINYNETLQKDTIDYDYFVKNSGIIRLENGIPSTESDEKVTYTLHFPTKHDYLANTTYTSNYYNKDPLKAKKAANGDVTWAYITGKDVFPYNNSSKEKVEANTINGKLTLNNYPISKGGTVVFTLQTVMMGLDSNYKYHSHLNKLIINGENINLPISELRKEANLPITQQYSRTAYTYLKTGELVAVNYVPLPDSVSPSITPWKDDLVSSPYYYVTVFNVQGDISIHGDDEIRKDGSLAVGNDFVFLQDGYGGFDLGTLGFVTLSQSGKGLVFGFDETYNVSTILQVDHDLDFGSAVIWSGFNSSAPFRQQMFPYGYFFDASAKNGFGIDKSRRLIVDNTHRLKFLVDKGSKANSDIRIDASDGTFRGRYYNQINVTTKNLEGNQNTGYFAKPDDGLYWLDFDSKDYTSEDRGTTLYRVKLTDKIFKSFSVQFQGVNGDVLQTLTQNGLPLDKDTYNNIVFPRTDNALTSSLKIDDFGNVSSLSKSNVQIGKTDNGLQVQENDEPGFIVIPDLPENANFYQLVKVNTNGTDIPLSNKKFLPGQKVFTGQFLPEGTDFGQAGGIDNNSVVTLKAVKVDSVNADTEKSKAETATDITKYDTVNTGIYAGDKVYADHFLSNVGTSSDLGQSAYSYVDAQGKLSTIAGAAGDKTSIYSFNSIVTDDKVWTLKSFGDNSYEIVSTNVTVNEKPKANIQIQNKEIVDPKTQNATGALSATDKLAWTTTSKSAVTLAKSEEFSNVDVGQDSLTPGQVSINSVNIPIDVWTSKANGDNQKLQIPFTAKASGVDDRPQPLTQIRMKEAVATEGPAAESPEDLLSTRLATSSESTLASRMAALVDDTATEPVATTTDEPTVDSDATPVMLAVTKADSPTPTAKGIDSETTVTVTFDKQPEEISNFTSNKSDSSYVKLTRNNQPLNITNFALSEVNGKYQLVLTVDQPLVKDDNIQVTYRYSARYNSTSTSFTVETKWQDISNTGVKLVTNPFAWMVVLIGGATGAYGFGRRRKRKMK